MPHRQIELRARVLGPDDLASAAAAYEAATRSLGSMPDTPEKRRLAERIAAGIIRRAFRGGCDRATLASEGERCREAFLNDRDDRVPLWFRRG